MRFSWLVLLCLIAPVAGAVDVAVLDTGVDPTHPQLDGRVERQSFVDPLAGIPGLPVARPDPGVIPDHDGRGTGVASLVAGATLGTAREARIWDLQVVAPQSALTDGFTVDAARRALEWVATQPDPPRIVVLSFVEDGVGPGADTLAAMAAALWEADILVIVPAGPDVTALHREGRVLTVGGTSGCRGTWDGVDGPAKPDVLAPDTLVEVASPSAPVGNGGTRTASGTAYSAAQVAGVAALLWQEVPALPIDALTAIVRVSAQPTGAHCAGAAGQVDADAALAMARSWRDPLLEDEESGVPVPFLMPVLALLWAGVYRRGL